MNTDTCPDCSEHPCDCGMPAGYKADIRFAANFAPHIKVVEATKVAEIIEQRDKFIEALEHTMKHMRHSLNCPARISEGLHACNCQMEWAYDNATEALQSLNQNAIGEARADNATPNQNQTL